MISGGAWAWDNIFGTRKEPTETTHTQYLLERLVDEVASLHMSVKYVYNNVFLYLTRFTHCIVYIYIEHVYTHISYTYRQVSVVDVQTYRNMK